MKDMTATDDVRMGTWCLRIAAWVMSSIACMVLPPAAHGQNTCMGATLQLQGYAQQVQMIAAQNYQWLQSQQQQIQWQNPCMSCGYDMYCQQACQAQVVQYFRSSFGYINQWYAAHMQQIGYWYDMLNAQCVPSAAPQPEPPSSPNGDNRRVEEKLDDLINLISEDYQPDKEVELRIPQTEITMDLPALPSGFLGGNN